MEEQRSARTVWFWALTPSHYVHEKFPSSLVKVYSRSAEEEKQHPGYSRAIQQFTTRSKAASK